jgi:hypothetical protein
MWGERRSIQAESNEKRGEESDRKDKDKSIISGGGAARCGASSYPDLQCRLSIGM